MVGRRQGVASANFQFSILNFKLNAAIKKKIEDLVNQAYEIAKISPEDPDFSHLPGKKEGIFKYQEVDAFSDKTAKVTPKHRAKEVALIIKMAKDKNLNAFGSLSSGFGEIVVANSHGVFAYHPYTQSLLNIRILGDTSTGYAGEINMDISKLEIESAAKRAIAKTILGKKQSEVKPGDFEVILEEPAVSEMMTYMTYLGFGARAYHEDRSFMSKSLGKMVMGENITIWDDAYNHKMLPMPFDFQGVPKEKTIIIEKGKAKSILYDHYLAQKYKTKPTGHGFPAPNTEDAFASNLHLMPGSTPRSQLLNGIKKGVLVSRFWYVRNVHPKELSITGMTRDGTFLIENGEIVSGLRNMRFTISIPKILSNVTHLSKETRLEPSDEGFGANLLPAIRTAGFTFTGVSKL
jgi:predicted Zn-dependent protease